LKTEYHFQKLNLGGEGAQEKLAKNPLSPKIVGAPKKVLLEEICDENHQSVQSSARTPASPRSIAAVTRSHEASTTSRTEE